MWTISQCNFLLLVPANLSRTNTVDVDVVAYNNVNPGSNSR
jgi:hypothetical protein